MGSLTPLTEVLIMRNVLTICGLLVLALITALGPALAAGTAVSLEEQLANNGFALGAEVPAITDYRLDDRIYLDSRHLIVPDGESRSYLVRLAKKCHSLHSNRLRLRTHTRNQIAPRDTVLPQYEGRSVDDCEVTQIHQLVPK